MIEFEQVSYWYSDVESLLEIKDEVLNSVSVVIQKGEFVVLLGRNGSGKSTLAKHCNGLLIPKRGKVTIDGLNTMQAENLWEIRQKVGLVFQNPDNQIIATTVEEDVAFGPENLGLPMEEIRRRLEEALSIVDMQDFRRKEPHLLSGGQKQRVAIAGVLAMHPEYLVLDEATSMLDPEGRGEIISLVSRLKGSITVFHITHYIEEAVNADRVMVMDEGRMVAQGTPREIFNLRDQIVTWGLELPQVTETAWLLREKYPHLFPTLPVSETELVDALCLSS
ncbi:MAG: energy-coupling factor transporter ATPase [Candidatus Atribacteria bacterium]|nr:energy-coupling factor transporter ATPase [Candidatus Atribacteria bacterium]